MGSELLSGAFVRDSHLRSWIATLELTDTSDQWLPRYKHVSAWFLFVARHVLTSLMSVVIGTIDITIVMFEGCPAHVALECIAHQHEHNELH